MKIKKQMVYCMAAVALQLLLTGCGVSQNLQMANELHFSLSGISDVTISYDDESITFLEADGDELIIKEYMTKNKRSYYANIKQSSDCIHVSEGGKPFFKDGFLRYVEVYLPNSYTEALTVTTTDGNINLSDVNLQLSMLRIDSTVGSVEIDNAVASDVYLSTTSGALKLTDITADTIRLDTTSGDVTCDGLSGNVTYTSTSGNADIKSAIGCGSYKANNSGRLDVNYAEVTGDLYFFNKNDDIRLTLPQDLAFTFEAATKNGTVSTTFQEYIAIDGRTARGTIGDNPMVTVKTETNNGNIEVTQ